MRSFWRWFLVGLFGLSSNAYTLAQAHVAVGQIVEHQALDTLRQSLKKGLEERGYVEGKNLTWTYENAQGNPTIAVQIGHKLTSLDPTVIVTLSTPMTQAVAASTSTIPIVFGAVTDPAAAKLTGLKNVTGLTDFVPSKQQIDLVKTFVPQVKTIGVIYNSGEANSQKQVQEIRAAAEQQGIKILEVTVSKSSEVSSATKTFVGQVDAILLPTDNTVISSLESILKIGIHNKIPIFGSDVDIVRRGAVAAYGVDWRQSGFILAEMVSDILKGVPVKKIPIQNPKNLVFHINLSAAEKMGVSVPESLRKQADVVF
ncbi:MAG TPA: ABC transporter substrate-binding protein [Alphaproteobacteria bacterium]|nr:ABC transporter substrate-binding protein [Alphaproteobacteria bacterium]